MSDKPHSQDSAGPLFGGIVGTGQARACYCSNEGCSRAGRCLGPKNGAGIVDRFAELAPLVPGHFDNPPLNAITAEQVRAIREPCGCSGMNSCLHDKAVRDFALRGLLAHPACPSSMRSVIEAALE